MLPERKAKATDKFLEKKKRPYYTLQQAAVELGTDADHLLSLGVMGEAQIVVRPRFPYIIETNVFTLDTNDNLESEINSMSKEPGLYKWPVMSATDLATLTMGYRPDLRGMGFDDVIKYFFFNQEISLSRHLKDNNPGIVKAGFYVIDASGGFTDEDSFFIREEDLYLLCSEVEELKKGKTNTKQQSEEKIQESIERPLPPKTAGSYFKTLKAVAEVAAKKAGKPIRSNADLATFLLTEIGTEVVQERTLVTWLDKA